MISLSNPANETDIGPLSGFRVCGLGFFVDEGLGVQCIIQINIYIYIYTHIYLSIYPYIINYIRGCSDYLFRPLYLTFKT